MTKLPVLQNKDEIQIELKELGIDLVEKHKPCISCKYRHHRYDNFYECKLQHHGACAYLNPYHNCKFWEEKTKYNQLYIGVSIGVIFTSLITFLI